MMLRKLAISLALAGVLSTSNANALGLGEIKINSALNEPLNAEIQLLEVRKLNPLQIQPRMADIDEHALAGVNEVRFLSGVAFKVILGSDGTGRIRLTSRDPVKEPFLNFLVEVNWPNGRLVREYTLLLDPPVYDPSKQRATVQPVSPVEAAPAISSKPAVVPKNIRTAMDVKKQVFVDVHDSLWGIADANRPDGSVTKSQMALALLKKNPHAFVGGNINHLKAGMVLDLPTLAEITALTPQQAAAEVRRQNDFWKSRGVRPADPAKPPAAPVRSQVVAAPKTAIEKPAVTVAAQAGDAEQTGVSGEALQAMEDARLALEQQLDATQGEMGKLQGENELLNDRLDMLQQQFSSIQSTIDSKDQNIEQLEAELLTQKTQLRESEKGLLATLTENPLYLAMAGGGLIAVLAAVLGLLFLKRRKARKEAPAAEAAVVAAVATAAAAGALAEPEEAEPEEEISDTASEKVAVQEDESDIALDEGLDDLADLDLDMDLDLDLDLDIEDDALSDTVLPAAGADEILLEDDEFDLGLEQPEEALAEEAVEEDIAADELEQLLVDELVDSASESGANLSDSDLEFVTQPPAESRDALDDILDGGGAEAESLDDLAFEIDDMGLDDLDDSPEEASEPENSVEFEIADRETVEEAPGVDDLDALLAQASQDAEADESFDSLELDADLEELSVETDRVTDKEELQQAANTEEPELDLDALFENPEAYSSDETSLLAEEELVLADDIESARPPEVEGSSSEAESDEELLDALEGLDFDLNDLNDLGSTESESEPLPVPSPDMQEGLPVAEIEDELPEFRMLSADELSEGELPDMSGSHDDLTDVLSEPGAPEAIVPESEEDFDAEIESLLNEVVEKNEPQLDSDTDSELSEIVLADDEAIAGFDIESDESVETSLESDNLDEVELDLAAFDIDELLEEIAVEAPEVDEPDVAEASLDAELDAELDAADELSTESDDPGFQAEQNQGPESPEADVLDIGLEETGLSSGEEFVPEGSVNPAEEELTANIFHDLDAELDSELQSLLNGADTDIGLEEEDADEEDEEVDGWALLDGADEVETKLDLARAYIDMEDAEGARDILQEIINEGSDQQKQEASELLGNLDK
ncbi:MAG: FimV/HubP family polar landmark protein [Pontibacterium sp.]